MRAKRFERAVAVMLVFASGFVSPVRAANFNSTAGGGLWSAASGTWTSTPPSGGPGTGDNVTIVGPVTYDASASGVVNQVTLNSGGILDLERVLTVSNDVNVNRNGRLDLRDQILTVQNNISFGGGGGGAFDILRDTGIMLVTNQITVSEGSNITLGSLDTSKYVYLGGSFWDGEQHVWSKLTTGGTSNATNWIQVDTCELTLGANVQLSEYFRVGGGNGAGGNPLGVVKMNGFSINAPDITFGGNGGGSINRTAANEVLTAGVSDGQGGVSGGTINVAEGSNLTMIAGDTAKYLSVNGAYWDGTQNVWSKATTAATSNVTNWIQVDTCELTLGANVQLSEFFRVGGGNGAGGNPLGVVKMNGFSITAPDIQFGGNGGGTLTRSSSTAVLTANNSISVSEGSNLTMIAGDTAKYLFVNGAHWDGTQNVWSTATTAATSNVTHGITVDTCELTLGANVQLSESFRVGGGGGDNPLGVVKMNGYSITAPRVDFGGNGAGRSEGGGKVFADELYVYENSLPVLAGGEIDTRIQLNAGSNVLTVAQNGAQLDGLSLDGNTLSIGNSAVLALQFDNDPALGLDWTFRWLGDRVSTLETLRTGNKLTWNEPSGGTPSIFLHSDGYTYVGYFSAVPEPATLGLAAGGGLAALLLVRRRHRRG